MPRPQSSSSLKTFALAMLVTILYGYAAASLQAEEEPKIISELIEIMMDPRQSLTTRVASARVIKELGPKAASQIPSLTQQLKRLRRDELELLQIEVILALAEMGAQAKSALPTLVEVAGRSPSIDHAIRVARKKILLSEDTVQVDSLIKELQHKDAATRLRAVKSIQGKKVPTSLILPELLKLLQDTDDDVRRLTISTIRQLQPQASATEEVLSALLIDLTSNDANIRLNTVRTIGQIGRPAANTIPILQKMLLDPDRDVRRAAADAITALQQ